MICGLVDFDGRLAPGDMLDAMLAATAHRGRDGTDRWTQLPSNGISADSVGVALGCHWRRITPEEQDATAPWHDAAAQVVVMADARLDNRAALCDQLAIAPTARPTTPDLALIGVAYLRWGEQMTAHLQGDFTIAIWDGRARQLLTFVGSGDSAPIYYTQHQGAWYFSNDMRALCAIPGRRPQPDLSKVAAFAIPFGVYYEPTRTFYADIHRQHSASLLRFDVAGTHPQPFTHRASRFAERDFPFRRDAEWIEAIREALFAAVRARLRTPFPVAALLSGGLDSSTICAVAATILAEEGRELLTYSGVLPPGADPQLQDERAYMDALRVFPNLRRIDVDAADCGPFDDLSALMRGVSTPYITTRQYLYAALTGAAHADGARVLFDGAGGEFSITQYGSGYLLEAALHLRLFEAMQLMVGSARTEGRSVAHQAKHELAKPLWSWLRGHTPPPRASTLLLRDDFVQAHQSTGVGTPSPHPSPFDHHLARRAQMAGMMHSYVDDVNLTYDRVRLLMPLTDARLVELCLAAPGRLKYVNGYRRGLVRRALADLLPPSILWRTSKMPFSVDFNARYRRDAPAVLEMVRDLAPTHPVAEIIDLPRLVNALAQSITAPPNSPLASFTNADRLTQTVYLLMFLLQFDP